MWGEHDLPAEKTVEETKTKLCEIGNLFLGGFLFASPWIFNYPSGAQSLDAIVLGAVIAILSITALATLAVWEEALNLIAGMWLFVSPWVLKFQGTTAMGVNVVIGIIVVLLAGSELSSISSSRPGQAAHR
jgi:hypothetical protein